MGKTRGRTLAVLEEKEVAKKAKGKGVWDYKIEIEEVNEELKKLQTERADIDRSIAELKQRLTADTDTPASEVLKEKKSIMTDIAALRGEVEAIDATVESLESRKERLVEKKDEAELGERLQKLKKLNKLREEARAAAEKADSYMDEFMAKYDPELC